MVAQDEDARIGVPNIVTQHPAMRATTLLRHLLPCSQIFTRDVQISSQGIIVQVAPPWHIPRCGECGMKCRRIHSARDRVWRDLDVFGSMTKLAYKIRRVHCEACQGVRTERVPWAPHASNFSYAFERRTAYLAQQCSKDHVCRLMRIAWRTVGWIIDRVVERALATKPDVLDGLKSVGVDELSYMRHHKYITIVVDHERQCVVWAREGKNAATLSAFFDDLGPDRASELEAVTMDLSKAYIKAAREGAPNAKIIFDRFHIQRLVMDALDKTRRTEVREAQDAASRRGLKGTKWTLLKGAWNMTAADHQTIEELAETNEPIFKAHMLKESLCAILDRRQVNVARKKLKAWIRDARRSGLEHFQKTAKTIEKHMGGILEYIRSGLNNGRVEGLNGKARTITRRSFGFHSAKALIAMLFLCCGGVSLTPGFSTAYGHH